MSTTLKFTPPRVPFADSRGYISREWQLFLAGLYERVGGSVSQSIPEVTADVAGAVADSAAALVAANTATDDVADLALTVAGLDAAILSMRLPVGAIHITVTPTNPATTLGYGTWSAFGTGRVLVGVDVGDTDFDTVEETGGSKTATI